MTPYETLVREHHALVYHVAHGILRDSAAAEDVTQDVFLKLLQNPSALARASNPRAYAARASVNRALEIRRENSRREKREQAVPARRRDMDPMEAAFRGELREQVAALPEDQRLVVDLHYFRGLGLAEVALALDVPQGTVASRVSAALGKLRSALAGSAFAALMAGLESELGRCEAGVLPPAGLEARLRGLERSRGLTSGDGKPTRSPISRRAVGVGAVAALLAFFLLARTSGLIPGGGEVAKRGHSQTDDSTSRTPDAGISSQSTIPAVEKEERGSGSIRVGTAGYGVEGFLCRGEEGLVLRAARWSGESSGAARRKDDPFGDAQGVEGLPVSLSSDFGPFLAGDCGPELAPQTYIVGSVNLTRVDDGPDRRSACVSSAEVLSVPWLEAWRAMVRAGEDLDVAWAMTPGPGRREAVDAAASRLDAAWCQAKSAREGESPVFWRKRAELNVAEHHATRLASMGRPGALSPRPDGEAVHALLRGATSVADWYAKVVAAWGKEGAELPFGFYLRYKDANGVERIALSQGWTLNSCYNNGDEAAFAKLRDEQCTLREQYQKQAPSPESSELRAKAVQRGLHLEDVSAEDRLAWGLDGGARVAAVEPGSSAAAAGFEAGDVLWRALGTPIQVPPGTDGWERFLAGLPEGTVSVEVIRSTGANRSDLSVRTLVVETGSVRR